MQIKKRKSLPQSTIHPLQQLGEAIRLKRQFKKMTLLDISMSIGAHRTTIGRLEQGDPAISIGILYQVLKILGSAENINKLAGDISMIQLLNDNGLLKRPRKRKKLPWISQKPTYNSINWKNLTSSKK